MPDDLEIAMLTATFDARPGAEPVVVLGYRFWRRDLGGRHDGRDRFYSHRLRRAAGKRRQ